MQASFFFSRTTVILNPDSNSHPDTTIACHCNCTVHFHDDNTDIYFGARTIYVQEHNSHVIRLHLIIGGQLARKSVSQSVMVRHSVFERWHFRLRLSTNHCRHRRRACTDGSATLPHRWGATDCIGLRTDMCTDGSALIPALCNDDR